MYCILHNIFIRKRQDHYLSSNFFFETLKPECTEYGLNAEQHITNSQRGPNKNSLEEAKRVRFLKMDYCYNEGSVSKK